MAGDARISVYGRQTLPNSAYEGDALTVVRSIREDKPLAKVHTWDDTWQHPKIERRSYSLAHDVTSTSIPVRGIGDLHRVLIALNSEPHKAVIRGEAVDGLDTSAPHRRIMKPRKNKGTGQIDPASYQGKPRCWLAIDVDKIANPEGYNPAIDTGGALEYLRYQLPECFHEISYVAQWTSSQNIDVAEGRAEPETLSARLWFWLDRPISDQQAKDWLGEKDADGRLKWPVDVSHYQPVGLHYTAAPTWTNGHEILPQRVTFWKGEADAVTVPEITPCAVSRWRKFGDDGVPRMVSIVADTMTLEARKKAVNVLASIWPRSPSNRHVLSMAVAGHLLRRGVSQPETEFIIEAGTAQADDDESDKRAANVVTTADAMRAGQPVTGFATIVALIGSEDAEAFNKAVSVKRTTTLPLPYTPPYFSAEGLVSLAEATTGAEDAIDAFWRETEAYNGWTDGGAAIPAASGFADIDKPRGPAPVHALNVTMGGGKTRIAIDRASNLPSGATMVHFVPDHSLSGELRDRYAANGVPARIVRGITQIGDDGRPMCQHVKAMMAWRSEGQAGSDLCAICPNRIGCNTEAQRAQKDQPGVIIAPHSYLAMEDEYCPFPKPDIAFIDENSLNTLTCGVDIAVAFPLHVLTQRTGFQDGARATKMQSKLIVGTGRTEDVNDSTGAVYAAIGRGAFSKRGLRSAGVTASDCRLASGVWYDRAVKLDPAVLAGKFTADAIEAAAANSLGDPMAQTVARFWKLLERYLSDDWPDDGAFNAFEMETATATDGTEYQRVRMVWRESVKLDCPVMLMDGTMNKAIARKLFPQLGKITNVRVDAPHVRAVQIDSELSKRKLGALRMQSVADSKTAANHVQQILDMAEVQAANHAPDANGCQTVISTYKAVREAIKRDYANRVEGDCPQYTRLTGGIEIAHLGNIRGADRWKDTGAIIIAGRPLPTAEALERVTRALYWDDPKPIASILPSDTLPKELRGIRMRNGTGLGVEVANHPDERCRAVLDQITGAEIEQTMHRLRLIRRTADNPATVILATCTVVDITVDRVTTWAALAPNPVEMMQARGVMPGNWQDVAAVLVDRFRNVKAAKEWFNRNPDVTAERRDALDALKLSQMPFIDTKGKMGSFRRYLYHPAQGYARTGYIDIARHPDPRAAIARWIGDATAATLTIECLPADRSADNSQAVSDVLLTDENGSDGVSMDAAPALFSNDEYRDTTIEQAFPNAIKRAAPAGDFILPLR